MNRPVTSASNLFRRALCPGSERMEYGLPDDDSEQSREGTLLHDYMAHPEYDRSVLPPHQRDLLERNDALIKIVLERVSDFLRNPEMATKPIRELQLENALISGKVDLLAVFPLENGAAFLNDTKFGYLQVERAELNLQLRAYAVLVSDYVTVQRIFVSITQPRLPYDERITLAEYKPDDVAASRDEIAGILKASADPKAKLVAGEEQCRYCKAKMICPAFQKTLTVPVLALKGKQELSKTAREAYLEKKVSELTDAQMEKMLLAIAQAGMVKPIVMDEARKRIEAGQLITRKLSKASEKRDIVDPQRAISLLEIAGVASKEQILSFCSLPLGTLEEKYREAHPGMTWSDARDKINKVLASVIEKYEQAPKVLRK
jgi:Protein of unknown function (DUF2800)